MNKKLKFKLKNYTDQINDWSQYEKLGLADSIKARCLDCCGYDRTEVKKSSCLSCPLYIYKEIYFNHRKYEDIITDYKETREQKIQRLLDENKEMKLKIEENIKLLNELTI